MQYFLKNRAEVIRVRLLSNLIGGEGQIGLLLDRKDQSAKIYFPPAPDDLEPRFDYMIANPPPTILEQIAWILDIVEDNGGNVVGYLQNHFRGYEELDSLCSLTSRPSWATPQVVRNCTYQAVVIIAELNAAGYLFPDLHGGQFLVAQNQKTRLIDLGSCQFSVGGKLFPCRRVRPEYQAPELHGFADWEESAPLRDERTDAWSLGTLIFELTMTCHPCDGVAHSGQTISRTERITKGIFPFHNSCKGFRLPPGAPHYRFVDRSLQELFERCFIDGHSDPIHRPLACEWADVLRHCSVLRSDGPPSPPATTTSTLFGYREAVTAGLLLSASVTYHQLSLSNTRPKVSLPVYESVERPVGSLPLPTVRVDDAIDLLRKKMSVAPNDPNQ